jgi:hypothetical protein
MYMNVNIPPEPVPPPPRHIISVTSSSLPPHSTAFLQPMGKWKMQGRDNCGFTMVLWQSRSCFRKKSLCLGEVVPCFTMFYLYIERSIPMKSMSPQPRWFPTPWRSTFRLARGALACRWTAGRQGSMAINMALFLGIWEHGHIWSIIWYYNVL